MQCQAAGWGWLRVSPHLYESLQLATEGGREHVRVFHLAMLVTALLTHKAAAYQCSTPRIQVLPIRRANGASIAAKLMVILGEKAALASR